MESTPLGTASAVYTQYWQLVGGEPNMNACGPPSGKAVISPSPCSCMVVTISDATLARVWPR